MSTFEKGYIYIHIFSYDFQDLFLIVSFVKCCKMTRCFTFVWHCESLSIRYNLFHLFVYIYLFNKALR